MKARLLMLTTTMLALALFGVSFVRGVVGAGVLEVYIDSNLAPQNAQGHYEVDEGITYRIRVVGIEPELGSPVTVKVCWTDDNGASQETTFLAVPVVLGAVEVLWEVPSEAQVCTTATVHYRNGGPEHVAAAQNGGAGVISNVGHMHIIPEVPLGAVAPLAAGLCALALLKRKRP